VIAESFACFLAERLNCSQDNCQGDDTSFELDKGVDFAVAENYVREYFGNQLGFEVGVNKSDKQGAFLVRKNGLVLSVVITRLKGIEKTTVSVREIRVPGREPRRYYQRISPKIEENSNE